MEPMMALTATSRSLPEKSISPTMTSPSAFRGVTPKTRSFRLTWISTLGFTSRETVASTRWFTW